ncbi:zinc ribbon domain-containing protein [Paenibacillus motobuensis]|uniref:zinc ribbon domain-containing protein n=1 Tax=Paenibacillus TaxID=44249 RepID=UPI00203A72D1|nr:MULTISPECIES: zinc ribbon domain-containing protein [Paenibacillus]MCM3038381.1 zinc ribbon domain-containing protein [Paenibacillus lutimineralis]MCM3645485.1 zinc ribbon domain-containing protein [Paenibacillus motobuensis]
MNQFIECPWCHHEIQIVRGRCPECHNQLYDVTEADFQEVNGEEPIAEFGSNLDEVIIMIEDRYKCVRCAGGECIVKEIAMTGSGVSRLLDVQHHLYLAVSCTDCGFTELYDADVLLGKKAGMLGSVLDLLFGR